MAGGADIGFNNSVFLSERDTADRNFALAYFMKENKCFPPGFNLQDTLDFYFQVQSSVICQRLAPGVADVQHGGDLLHPVAAGRVSGQRRRVPGHRDTCARLARGQGRAQPHAQLRHVQLQRTVRVQGLHDPCLSIHHHPTVSRWACPPSPGCRAPWCWWCRG